MTIHAEDTPNPHALKFNVALAAPGTPPRSYRDAAAARAAGDALATSLFNAGPVTGVLILPGFVTVSKTPAARWSRLRPRIEAVLRNPPSAT